MPTVQLVQMYKQIAAKPPYASPGRNNMREWLLTNCERELKRRRDEAARKYGLS